MQELAATARRARRHLQVAVGRRQRWLSARTGVVRGWWAAWSRHVLRTAGTILMLATILGQASRWWPVADMAAVALPLTSCLLPLLVAAAIIRGDRMLAIVALAGMGMAGERVVAGWRHVAPAMTAVSRPITILNFNVYRDNWQPGAVERVVAEARPDIAVFEEADGTVAAQLDRVLPRYHRARWCGWSPCSLVILSRWPIRPLAGGADARGVLPPHIFAVEVAAPGGRFRLVAVHLPRPGYPAAAAHRAALLRTVRRLAPPVIVAGDFNLPPGSVALDRFETASRLGRVDGFVPSYAGRRLTMPFAAIDHVYVSAGGRSGGCRSLPPGGSDHRAILCRVGIPVRHPVARAMMH